MFHARDETWRRRPVVPSSAMRAWLVDRGSLTRRIQARCAQFRVLRMRQAHARPLKDELAPLRLKRGQLALVREVVLYCGDVPLVFAHSVLALKSLRGRWRWLRGFGGQSLGEALFSNPRVVRRPLRFKRLDSHHGLRERARMFFHGVEPRWARRSIFSLEGLPILVTEVYLPAILDLNR